MAFSEDNSVLHYMGGGADATFRAWAQKIHDMLSAVGLVQTSDTGQINLTTVTMPASNGTGGYEIWRFNDAEQGADPIYLRISYGRGTSGWDAGRITFQVGRGSDGAGALTNAGSAIGDPIQNSVSTTLSGRMYASMLDGAFCLVRAGDPGAADSMVYFTMIERVRKRDGTIASGEVAFLHTVSSMASNSVVGSATLQTFLSGSWNTAALKSGHDATPSVSNEIGVGHIRGNHAPRLPLRSVLFCLATTTGAEDSGNIQVGTETRQYKRMAGGQTVNGVAINGTGKHGLLVPNA